MLVQLMHGGISGQIHNECEFGCRYLPLNDCFVQNTNWAKLFGVKMCFAPTGQKFEDPFKFYRYIVPTGQKRFVLKEKQLICCIFL